MAEEKFMSTKTNKKMKKEKKKIKDGKDSFINSFDI